MICTLCGDNTSWHQVKHYSEPDKYERLAEIELPLSRAWHLCIACGLYQSSRSYDPQLLDTIYLDGYRSEEFRGETIKQTFDRIRKLPTHESENAYRVKWINKHLKRGTLLDIGSGFGIFPYVMKWHGWKVTCVEPNRRSAVFIEHDLGIECINQFYGEGCLSKSEKYDVVALVHVMEHMPDPEAFLNVCKGNLKGNGHIYVEVPDSVEFNSLPDDHDEFNSTHLHFLMLLLYIS